MTIRYDLSVNWDVSPRIITVASPSVEITMQDLYDTLRDLEDDPGNMDEEYIVSGAGKEQLGGGVLVGLTITLNNAKLAFEARTGPSYIQCNVSGGNLVAIDDVGASMGPIEPTAFTQIVLANSSSSTLIDNEYITEILQLLENRLEVNEASSELWLYNDAGDTVIKKWPLLDKDGNAIVLQGTGPANRGVKIL